MAKKWEILVELLPATVDELVARTGWPKTTVQGQIDSLRKIGLVKPAYKIYSAKLGRRAIMVYGHINAMPTPPAPPPKKKPQPKPPKVHVINSQYRTIWVGGNPYEVSHASN